MNTQHPREPGVNGLGKKIRFLERRRDNLVDRVTNKQGTDASLNFDRSEIAALETALDALRYHWATISRLDTPLTILQELVEAVEAGDRVETAESVARAKEVLADYSPKDLI